MSKRFKANVNNTFKFDIDEDQLSKLDSVAINDSKFHVLQDHTSYVAEIAKREFNQKKYTVKINNNAYVVEIQDALDELIKDMGFEVGASKTINEIKAPMPGLILDINITIGQEVKENDTLLILEAMKMENVLISPRTGIIKFISVSKGDAVDKNQLLVEFEV